MNILQKHLIYMYHY